MTPDSASPTTDNALPEASSAKQEPKQRKRDSYSKRNSYHQEDDQINIFWNHQRKKKRLSLRMLMKLQKLNCDGVLATSGCYLLHPAALGPATML